MKKILVFMFLTISFCSAREEIPILPMDRGVDIRYSDNNLDLINVDKMKKGNSIKEIKDEMKEQSQNSIQIDTRYLRYQRALDYITRPNNYLTPPVL